MKGNELSTDRWFADGSSIKGRLNEGWASTARNMVSGNQTFSKEQIVVAKHYLYQQKLNIVGKSYRNFNYVFIYLMQPKQMIGKDKL